MAMLLPTRLSSPPAPALLGAAHERRGVRSGLREEAGPRKGDPSAALPVLPPSSIRDSGVELERLTPALSSDVAVRENPIPIQEGSVRGESVLAWLFPRRLLRTGA